MGEGGVTIAADAAVRARKERVHTTMLIELLALLIFLAFAFAFALKDEGDRLNPWKQKYDQVVEELSAAKAKINQLTKQVDALEAKIASLERSIERLAAAHEGPLPPNDRLIRLPKSEYDRLLNFEALHKESQRENATLRSQIKGGTDRPNCPVTPGFLIAVELLGDGNLRVRSAWADTANAGVATVTGALDLARSGTLTQQQFRAKAAFVDQWARAQSPACGFRARVTESHGNLELYKRQVRTVEQYFYVRRD